MDGQQCPFEEQIQNNPVHFDSVEPFETNITLVFQDITLTKAQTNIRASLTTGVPKIFLALTLQVSLVEMKCYRFKVCYHGPDTCFSVLPAHHRMCFWCSMISFDLWPLSSVWLAPTQGMASGCLYQTLACSWRVWARGCCAKGACCRTDQLRRWPRTTQSLS